MVTRSMSVMTSCRRNVERLNFMLRVFRIDEAGPKRCRQLETMHSTCFKRIDPHPSVKSRESPYNTVTSEGKQCYHELLCIPVSRLITCRNHGSVPVHHASLQYTGPGNRASTRTKCQSCPASSTTSRSASRVRHEDPFLLCPRFRSSFSCPSSSAPHHDLISPSHDCQRVSPSKHTGGHRYVPRPHHRKTRRPLPPPARLVRPTEARRRSFGALVPDAGSAPACCAEATVALALV